MNRDMAKAIRDAARDQDFTQESLAKRCGVGRATVQLIMQGKGNPTIGTILKVCKVLKLKVVFHE
jgi:transcriptional regulator with XRE-family HTH domain